MRSSHASFSPRRMRSTSNESASRGAVMAAAKRGALSRRHAAMASQPVNPLRDNRASADDGQYGCRCDELQATRVVAAGCVVEAEVDEDRGHEEQTHCCEEACLHESPIGPNSGPAGLERVAKIGANFEQRKILIHWSDAIDGPVVIQVAFLYEIEDLAGI